MSGPFAGSRDSQGFFGYDSAPPTQPNLLSSSQQLPLSAQQGGNSWRKLGGGSLFGGSQGADPLPGAPAFQPQEPGYLDQAYNAFGNFFGGAEPERKHRRQGQDYSADAGYFREPAPTSQSPAGNFMGRLNDVWLGQKQQHDEENQGVRRFDLNGSTPRTDQQYPGGYGHQPLTQPQTQVPAPQLPQEGHGPEATRQRCENLLLEFQEVLLAVDADLKKASPEQYGSLMGSAIKKCRGVDKQAQALLRELPSSLRDGLQQQHRRLAESLSGLEGQARPYMKELPKPATDHEISDALVGKLSGEAPILHERLEDLNSALDAWVDAVKKNTSFGGGFDQTGVREEEKAVQQASAAFEDFRAGLAGQKSSFFDGLTGKSPKKDAQKESEATRMAIELLHVLQGFSPWCDAAKIQELLRRRQTFFIDAKHDPQYLRFQCGKRFLELVRSQQSWPEAEPLAMHWPKVMEKNLGDLGAKDWQARAQRQGDLLGWTTAVAVGEDHSCCNACCHASCADCYRYLLLYCGAAAGSAYGFYDYVLSCCTNAGARASSSLGGPSLHYDHLPVAGGHDSGLLKISRIRAHNLRHADYFDESDPYVIFRVGERQNQTNVVWNNEKNPVWQEEVTLKVDSLSRTPFLDVIVQDYDKFSSDDPLGQHRSNVGALIKATMDKRAGFWNYLSGAAGATAPEVYRVKERLTGNGAAPESIVEFEFIWIPQAFNERGAVGSASAQNRRAIHHVDAPKLNPLVLQPDSSDELLPLIRQVQATLPKFMEGFESYSEGFFLASQDMSEDSMMNPDITYGAGKAPAHASKSAMQEVATYNRLLSDIRQQTLGFVDAETASILRGKTGPTRDEAFNLHRLNQLLEQVRAVERGVARDPSKRRLFAFQDELLPAIGEWSTDRRRKLRNQVFLAQLQSQGVASVLVRTTTEWSRCLVPLFMVLAVLCHLLAAANLFFNSEEAGRGWHMIGWCLAGFACLSAAIATSFPRWKPYFEKPRHGRHYMPLPVRNDQPRGIGALDDTAGFIPGGASDSGLLRISHIQAYDLSNADWFDASDPYVIFRIGRSEKKTGVVWNNQKNPQWKNADGSWQEVVLRVDSLNAAGSLEIIVMDKDTITRDDPLGSARTDIAAMIETLLPGAGGAFGWLTGSSASPGEALRINEHLTGRGSNPQSKIEFSVQWQPGRFGQPTGAQLPQSAKTLLGHV
eukprot:TRINITY_DN27588_c0_g1_i1.p1 TRINITY_DN27588_c0_g1~~TRINITY_DN27588_c0_g1_i1.p1  ORF type:complete len:1198 (-),score=213.36 TRINITY_DN27588_c0_g1_i1:3-3596(-)